MKISTIVCGVRREEQRGMAEHPRPTGIPGLRQPPVHIYRIIL